MTEERSGHPLDLAQAPLIEAAEAAGTAFGKDNLVAERAVVNGDLRRVSLEQLKMARDVMREIVAESLPGTDATITFDDGYPPLAPSEGIRMMLQWFSEVSQALGYGEVEAVDPRNAGAADVSFTAGLAEYAIDGLGPGDEDRFLSSRGTSNADPPFSHPTRRRRCGNPTRRRLWRFSVAPSSAPRSSVRRTRPRRTGSSLNSGS